MFLACVAIWGTTWLAITFQLGPVAPEASVAWRFGLAALVLIGLCHRRGYLLRFPARIQMRLVAMGLSMFTAGYLFVYYAEMHVVSGLVAVGYCASPLVNQWAQHLAFGRGISRRVTIGGLLGIVGIGCIFWPELATLSADRNVWIGGLLTMGGVLSSAVGNLFSSQLERDGVNVWQKMCWSMGWGAAGCLVVAGVRGVPIGFSLAPSYLMSLAYLAILGSIVTFSYYLRLIETIGAGRAGYIGVMTPIVALTLSSVFEHYDWQPLSFAGIAVAVLGNLLIVMPAERLRFFGNRAAATK
jgi:drug/metabolite transporter (DMT)-like permease